VIHSNCKKFDSLEPAEGQEMTSFEPEMTIFEGQKMRSFP
jgi:hypothetical protein